MRNSITNDDTIIIGYNIRKIRKETKLKQTELVALIQLQNVSITREALCKIEAGTQHIKASQFRAIKKALNCSYDDLLANTEPKPKRNKRA